MDDLPRNRFRCDGADPPRADICDRIDAALEKMAFRRMEVRAIYLTPGDRLALSRAMTRKWREETGSKARLHPCSYRGHHLRPGKASAIYSTHGIAVVVPKLLSRRCVADLAKAA
jgi:hypothetical protein